MDGATWGSISNKCYLSFDKQALETYKSHNNAKSDTTTWVELPRLMMMEPKSLFTSRSSGAVSSNHSCTDGSAHSPWFVQSNPRLTCSDAIPMVDSPPPMLPASSPMLPQAHLLALVLSPCRKTPCFSQGGNVVSLGCKCMPSCWVCMCSFVPPFSIPLFSMHAFMLWCTCVPLSHPFSIPLLGRM